MEGDIVDGANCPINVGIVDNSLDTTFSMCSTVIKIRFANLFFPKKLFKIVFIIIDRKFQKKNYPTIITFPYYFSFRLLSINFSFIY